MHFITRLASDPTLCSYPLPLNGSLTWHRVGVSNAGGASIWRTNLCVKNIPEGHILVPSYVCTEKGYQYQWQARTEAANQTSVLLPIGPAQADSWTGFVPAKDDAHALQSKIDCWHSRSNIEELDLQLTLYIPNSDTLPNRDLFTLCIRPVDQQTCRLPTSASAVAVPRPAPVSQMQADNEIARRICSPTATAMAVMGDQAMKHWSEAVEQCYDPNTKAYGKWPLAIYWASQHGVLGCVETLYRWDEALTVLQAGQPIVCSIRFAKGQLPGSPQEQSGGHLVVLYGVEFDHKEGFALVMDPAGATIDSVSRRYPLAAFTEAWLNHRGAAYLFSTKLTKHHGSDPVSAKANDHGH
jgi:hypothetical protein